MPPSGPGDSVHPWIAGPSIAAAPAQDLSAPLPGSGLPPTIAPAPSPFLSGDQSWRWQFLPEGLLYKAYLAGPRESRLSTTFVHQRSGDWTWDPTIGAHFGVLRYGNEDPLGPEGWQVDVEAAAFPRIRLDALHTMVAMDFRFGVPLTWRRGAWEWKFGYYHECSHLGDEYMVEQLSLARSNYMRDALVLGVAVRPIPLARFYAEADWAFVDDDGAKPWHFQFGVDVSPAQPNHGWPYPFLAINTRLREEVDFSGGLTVQTGLQWRSRANRLLRMGLQYFNGLSDQAQFTQQFEEQIGFGIWYDY